MKAVILAGGLGTRLSEETHLRPKPMVEIGGKPLLWHILRLYSYYDINDFIICCGYKGYIVKEYFANYFLHTSDVTFDMATNEMEVHAKNAEPWRVTLVDTGDLTETGGRLKRVARFLTDDCFCFTYGDGLIDLDINRLLAFHRSHGRWATVTAVNPPGRYGALVTNEGKVNKFSEKPESGGQINGGFFVLNQECLDLIGGDEDAWEGGPVQALVEAGQLMAFSHGGFWQPMDTLREKNLLEDLWSSGKAPWRRP